MIWTPVAATNAENEKTNPFDVVCTGAVLHDQLREIDGRDEKNRLARRLGAELFVAPGTGKPWFLSPGLSIKQAVVSILKERGITEAEIADRTNRVFVERQSGPFARAIQELTANFVGRDKQIEQVFDWIEADVTPDA